MRVGDGIKRDPARAVQLFQQAIAAHHAEAHYILSELLENGEGMPRDLQAAMGHLRRAAEAGDIQAMRTLANKYLSRPEAPKAQERAEEWLLKAREAGLVLAQRNQTDAQMSLSILFGMEQGALQEDRKKANYWLRRAALQGSAEAQYVLANTYGQGAGIDCDPVQALTWFRHSAEQGYVPALLSLGAAYENGDFGLQKDSAEAVRWYTKARETTQTFAENGNPDAAYRVTTFYRKGLGGEQDLSEALNWLHRAAELDQAQAQMELGEHYRKGMGVTQSSDEALHWFKRAADNGNPPALFLMGRVYDEGYEVERDYVEAYAYYAVSAQKGYTPAGRLLEEMETSLRPNIIRKAKRKAQEMMESFGLITENLVIEN